MSIASPASASLARYSFRRSILEPEKTYTLFPDRLEIAAEGQPPAVHPLDRVREVHLKFERTKQRAYFNCIIHTDGGRVALRHVHWGGVMVFHDRRESYAPFVRALLLALASRPGVHFRAGSMVNFVTAIVGLPLTAILGVLAFTAGLWPATALAALMGIICVSLLGRSRPRTFHPAHPPSDLLPE
jgi:hypothetical protein